MNNVKHKTTIYLNDKAFEKLNKIKKQSGLTKSSVIQKMILNTEIHAIPSEELIKIFGEVNSIGNNINQIARIANTNKHISCEQIHEVIHLQGEAIKAMRNLRWNNH